MKTVKIKEIHKNGTNTFQFFAANTEMSQKNVEFVNAFIDFFLFFGILVSMR